MNIYLDLSISRGIKKDIRVNMRNEVCDVGRC